MSIVFRLKYALGLIPSAGQLDAKWDKLIKMRDDLIEVENSNELKQFESLKSLIESSAFQHTKREIESLQYSGSKEEKLILEHKALANSNLIKNYHKIARSEKLTRFENILTGSDLKRFLDLQQIVECNDFKIRKEAQGKQAFIKSQDYVAFKEYEELRKSPDIRFWRKFSLSDGYLSYLKAIGSKELKRLEELAALTCANDFNERVAYLKDRKRFLKSAEYKSILAFNELDKSKFMAEYRALKKANQLDFFKRWEIAFEETFSESTLNSKHWQAENWLAMKMAGVSFSQQGEVQCFNGVKNIQLNNGTLAILAKKEKLKGKVWDPKVGFIPKDFEYSTSILNCAEYFRFKEGVLEAKVRFRKDASITSAFSLTGDRPFPQIDFFRSTKNGVGFGIVENSSAQSSNYFQLSGLNDEHFHIFRLELSRDELVWKINDTEVYRCSSSQTDPMFFNLLTTLHGAVNEHLLPHRFEVEWIRCFSPKS